MHRNCIGDAQRDDAPSSISWILSLVQWCQRLWESSGSNSISGNSNKLSQHSSLIFLWPSSSQPWGSTKWQFLLQMKKIAIEQCQQLSFAAAAWIYHLLFIAGALRLLLDLRNYRLLNSEWLSVSLKSITFMRKKRSIFLRRLFTN